MLLPASAVDIQFLPHDTELVFTVHWKRILDSELVKGQRDALDPAKDLLEQFPGIRLARTGLKRAGFDVFRDLHRITYAGPRNLDAKKYFLILEGKFDAAKLSAVFKSGTANVFEIAAPGEPRLYAGLANPTTLIAASTRQTLADALARSPVPKKSGLNKDLKQLLERDGDRQAVSFAGTGAALARLMDGSQLPNAALASATLRTVGAVSGGVTLDKVIRFQLAVKADSEDTAKKLAASAGSAGNILQTLVRQQTKEDAKLLPLLDVVKTVRVTSQGSVILVRAEATLDVLERLMSNMPVEPGKGSRRDVTDTKKPERMAMLSTEEAWKRLPGAPEKVQPLPAWARMLAGPLPLTTARMLELDARHRTGNRLDPKLRGLVRWAAADADRCNYAKAVVVTDLRRAGLSEDEIKSLTGDPDRLAPPQRAAATFARKMMRQSYAVTDDEVKQLLTYFGEERVVAMVALLAHAAFQDRIFLATNVHVEPDGPLPPLTVTFARPKPNPPASGTGPAPTIEMPAQGAGTDTAWLGLQKNLDKQRARSGRIRVPSREELLKRLGPDHPGAWQADILWSRVCYGYQPELTDAWFSSAAAFRQEAGLARLFEQSLFWVVTRSQQCFY
jgi:alkylhydroperoxidase family enzyme